MSSLLVHNIGKLTCRPPYSSYSIITGICLPYYYYLQKIQPFGVHTWVSHVGIMIRGEKNLDDGATSPKALRPQSVKNESFSLTNSATFLVQIGWRRPTTKFLGTKPGVSTCEGLCDPYGGRPPNLWPCANTLHHLLHPGQCRGVCARVHHLGRCLRSLHVCRP